MSQNKQILKHLKEGKTITPIDALNLFGSFRLGARIKDLREMNHDIKTDMITQDGKTFAKYSMPEYKQARQDIKDILHKDIQCNLTIDDISSIYNDFDDWYDFKELDLVTAADLLQNGYVAI